MGCFDEAFEDPPDDILESALLLLKGDREFDLVYASPLQRAHQTALRCFNAGLIVVDTRLSERCLGEWQGCSKEEIRRTCPQGFLSSGKMNPFFCPPGGESLNDLVARVTEFLEDAFHSGHQRIGIVTHNGVIGIIRAVFENVTILESYSEDAAYLVPISYSIERNGFLESLKRTTVNLFTSP